jgi:hypothetical protein
LGPDRPPGSRFSYVVSIVAVFMIAGAMLSFLYILTAWSPWDRQRNERLQSGLS